MDNYNYSIIIPHKNSPELLKRCIESIPKRPDVQIIVVDDNSDKSIVDFTQIDFCREIEVVLTKDGRGAGFARNQGLKHALGCWVLFLDCDDIYTEKIVILLDKYKDSRANVVYFNYNRIKDEVIIYNTCQYLNKLTDENVFQMKYGVTMPWNKMVKRSFIESNNISFEECPVGNDILYSYQVGFHSRNEYEVENNAIYNYYETAGSITRNKINDESYYLTICKHIYQCNTFYRFMGRKEPAKSILSKFASILCKKGFSQFWLCLKVFIGRYKEIRDSRYSFVQRMTETKQ